MGKRGIGMWLRTLSNLAAEKKGNIQGVDACQMLCVPVLWRPYLGRQCIRSEGVEETGMETPAQRDYTTGYGWPAQDVEFFAVGLLVGRGRWEGRGYLDSSERGRGPGTCRAIVVFEICKGQQP